MQRKQIRSSTSIVFADTVNNNAEFDTNWDKAEYFHIPITAFDTAYGGNITLEHIQCVGGAGQQPVEADKAAIEILIADNSSFADATLIALKGGLYSAGLFDTSKRLVHFSIKEEIAIDETQSLFFTIKCPSGDAFTCTGATITVSQS